ncbi:hypothetical protein DFJ43DRAFT_780722 [Lentinula guzmanii]|uniref:Uncharacterized protein n=1 Tax=Lentinula guzmanii TaxID=2804957 RepID=A0AA38MRD3_9AGAR|nr:hypothetical protein DFJ43DRAFT_780722 [Lentinula guzmanii]
MSRMCFSYPIGINFFYPPTTTMRTTLFSNILVLSLLFAVKAAPENKDTLERREMIIRACPAACAVNCPDCCIDINCPDLCCVSNKPDQEK